MSASFTVDEHDWKRFPELTNTELEMLGITSPHAQITSDFLASVVKVHDGDTVTLRCDFRDFDFPLRLLSIDAPELDTGVAGEEARNFLSSQVLGEQVEVRINRFNRVERWGRLLGDVYKDGVNVGESMLHAGIVKPFERRREGEIPSLDQTLGEKQWF